MMRPISARVAPFSPVLLISARAMWPVTMDVRIRARPPIPVTCPKGAIRAVTRLTMASVLVRRPATIVEPGPCPPPMGTTVEGLVCWPTTCVCGAWEGSSAGGVPTALSLGIQRIHGAFKATYNRSGGGFPRRVDKAPAARGSGRARRVPVSRRQDAGHLCRQGAAPARPAALLLHRRLRRDCPRLGTGEEDL